MASSDHYSLDAPNTSIDTPSSTSPTVITATDPSLNSLSKTTTTTTTARTPPQPLTISPLTSETLPSYRRLLTVLLPIPYSKSFFSEALPDSPTTPPSSIALVALWQQHQTSSDSSTGTLIGAIQARICPPDPRPSLYIQTLAVLAPYRHLGVATHLLSTLIERARVREPKLGFVWAHVWEASEEALEWYVKRGFEVLPDVVKWYYRRLRPAGARVVIMELEEGRGEGG